MTEAEISAPLAREAAHQRVRLSRYRRTRAIGRLDPALFLDAGVFTAARPRFLVIDTKEYRGFSLAEICAGLSLPATEEQPR